jgi:hypothetical protein
MEIVSAPSDIDINDEKPVLVINEKYLNAMQQNVNNYIKGEISGVDEIIRRITIDIDNKNKKIEQETNKIKSIINEKENGIYKLRNEFFNEYQVVYKNMKVFYEDCKNFPAVKFQQEYKSFENLTEIKDSEDSDEIILFFRGIDDLLNIINKKKETETNFQPEINEIMFRLNNLEPLIHDNFEIFLFEFNRLFSEEILDSIVQQLNILFKGLFKGENIHLNKEELYILCISSTIISVFLNGSWTPFKATISL